MSEILVVYCQIQGGFHTVKINVKKEESLTGENKKNAPTDLLVDKRNAHNEKKCPVQKKLPKLCVYAQSKEVLISIKMKPYCP